MSHCWLLSIWRQAITWNDAALFSHENTLENVMWSTLLLQQRHYHLYMFRTSSLINLLDTVLLKMTKIRALVPGVREYLHSEVRNIVHFVSHFDMISMWELGMFIPELWKITYMSTPTISWFMHHIIIETQNINKSILHRYTTDKKFPAISFSLHKKEKGVGHVK